MRGRRSYPLKLLKIYLSDEEALEESSEDDEELTMLIRGFKKFLRRKNLAKLKENKRSKIKRLKEVTMNTRSLDTLKMNVQGSSIRESEPRRK